MSILFHISDLHFGREDEGALRWVEEQIAHHRPRGLIVTGDYTMRARQEEFDAAAKWLGSQDVPIWCEIGNHDMPYFNPAERIKRPFSRYYGMVAAAKNEVGAYQGEAIGGYRLGLVSLRTTSPFQKRWPWVDGWITDEALDSCLDELERMPSGVKVLVCAHHPLPEYDPSGKRRTVGGNRAMEELARRGVLAVLSGHIHDPFDRTEQTSAGALRMIGAGTLSTRLRSSPPGFNILRWEGGELSCEAVSYPAAVRG